jgi:CRISPR-associated protein Csd1
MGGRGMILESLVELAQRESLLTNPDYEPKPVAWVIVIGDGGKFVNAIPTAGESGEGKKAKGKMFSIPRRVGRTSGACADFLVDKPEYVFGIKPDGQVSKRDPLVCLDLFRKSVREALESTKLPALAAVSEFLENDLERGMAFDRIKAHGYSSNDLCAFEFQGERVHEIPGVQTYFSRTRRPAGEHQKQCLICGTLGAPVDKHPSVKIPGGTTSGIALVSFNSDAFESYGLDRNENAPVCRNCADGYTTALNRLLSDNYPDPNRPGETLPRRRVRLSTDTTAIFWADEEARLLNLFSSFFDEPRVEDVESLLRSPYKGHHAAPG